MNVAGSHWKKDVNSRNLYSCINQSTDYSVVPSYISEVIHPLISEITDYPLRNQNNINVPFSRTETLEIYVFLHLLHYRTLSMQNYVIHHVLLVLNTN